NRYSASASVPSAWSPTECASARCTSAWTTPWRRSKRRFARQPWPRSSPNRRRACPCAISPPRLSCRTDEVDRSDRRARGKKRDEKCSHVQKRPENLLMAKESPMSAKVVLTVVQGKLKGKQYVFRGRTHCVLGRADCCHPRLPDDLEHRDVSRMH